jgi:hypothetical protein
VKGLGGYTNGGTVPGVVVQGALDFIDASMAKIVAAIDPRNTVVILSAKHGQSPLDRSLLRLIDDGEVTSALDAAWNLKMNTSTGLVAFAIDDDGMLLWLKDRSKAAANFAQNFLWNYKPLKVGGSNPDGSFHNYDGTVSRSGLRIIYAGEEAADFIGVRKNDDRVPDVIGIAQIGTVYSSPTKIKKISEHGGDAEQDRYVPIVVWGANVERATSGERVETTQIAPTILKLLGLPADELIAVKKEGTDPLPDID